MGEMRTRFWFAIIRPIVLVFCEKNRSWLGPEYFFDGNVPPPRFGFGMVAIDENLLIFGGLDNTGNLKTIQVAS